MLLQDDAACVVGDKKGEKAGEEGCEEGGERRTIERLSKLEIIFRL